MSEVYGKDNNKPYLFTGLQIYQKITRGKVSTTYYEWNSVDGYIFNKKRHIN